jgi:hypothetical protein
MLALDIDLIAFVERGETGGVGDREVYRHRRHADLRDRPMRNRDATRGEVDFPNDDMHPRSFLGVGLGRSQLFDAFIPVDA